VECADGTQVTLATLVYNSHIYNTVRSRFAHYAIPARCLCSLRAIIWDFCLPATAAWADASAAVKMSPIVSNRSSAACQGGWRRGAAGV